MPRPAPRKRPFTAVELFAGAGGLSVGLERAGFRIALAVEIMPDFAATLAANHPGTKVVNADVHGVDFRAELRAQGLETYVLSTEACTRCAHCTYPDAPCRHPDEMYPCTESHAIIVTDIAERYGIEFITGNVVTWFSILFFRQGQTALA